MCLSFVSKYYCFLVLPLRLTVALVEEALLVDAADRLGDAALLGVAVLLG